MLWGDDTQKITVLDFETLGVGGFGIDIGLFLCVGMRRHDRNTHFEGLVKRYYDGLMASGKVHPSMTFDICRKRIIDEGIRRFVV